MNNDRRTIGIEQACRTVRQCDVRVQDMGPERAIAPDELVRHVPGMRSACVQVAMLVLAGLVMAAGGLEAIGGIAGSGFVDVETMLPSRNIRQLHLDQDA